MFFEKFEISKGKIVKYHLSSDVKELIKNGLVRVRETELRNPSINLTYLFSPIFKVFTNTVAVEQARERLKRIYLLEGR